MRKFLKWLIVLCAIILIIALVSINIFATFFTGQNSQILSYFNDLNTRVHIDYIEFEDTQIRCIRTGPEDNTLPLILFIHGAPGSAFDYKEYLADYDLKSQFRLVSMDRLGYGHSDFGHSEINIERHARAAATVIQSFENQTVFVVSHSYGCPVAGKLAADYPDLLKGFIMLAPLNDPNSEPLPLYSIFAHSIIGKLVLPTFIDVASDEKIRHAESLRQIENDWSKISVPVLHIHGEKDGLAPFRANVTFSQNNINPTVLSLRTEKNMGHLLLWLNAGYVKSQMLNFISKNS